ncbi:hypothetical protein ABT061_16480 [Streptosporangium sp. NPDC002544]|uniref:hypothetical protein n=1 Tax=Streptosporangium sp. NPDC002544 TaxID=3154538 RepID=UPI003318D284
MEPDLPAANPGPAWALVVESVAARYGLSASRLNVLGRYSFTASNPAADALRPLRDPSAGGLDEDEEE